MALSLKSLISGARDALPRLRFGPFGRDGLPAGLFVKSPEALELERMNPLRGVDEWRLGQIFDDARDGVFADLAWLYNEIEGVEPALLACCETRESAAGELGWVVRTADAERTRDFDETLADEQRAALLAEFGAVADDLPELAGHMVSAFFRGAAHALPLWDESGSLAGFRPLDLWNFALSTSGTSPWTARAASGTGTRTPRATRGRSRRFRGAPWSRSLPRATWTTRRCRSSSARPWAPSATGCGWTASASRRRP